MHLAAFKESPQRIARVAAAGAEAEAAAGGFYQRRACYGFRKDIQDPLAVFAGQWLEKMQMIIGEEHE